MVVDDCSPAAGEDCRGCDSQAEVWLFRVEKDVPWGWPAAKNIAMHEIPDGPALLTDIDHLLEADDAARLSSCGWPAMRTTSPGGGGPSTGWSTSGTPRPTFCSARSTGRSVASRSAGWAAYGTDFMMRKRIRRLSDRVELDDVWLTLYGREVVPDASTTCFGRKGSEYHLHTPEMKRAANGPVQVVMSQPYHRVC